ncbi:anthranilate synthase component I family protein [Herbiconiux ginsengi]|uniref:Chorismate binding enzyme n=1 Tax=Herbiconiux ginsengi TaxID=381665 RepID=A0A1H3LMY9_9MICO|nr:anthranilate synthase component I family protein [Herbiconiux ginsengi]SDY65907.1 chorismate binding enzyme [Herbiconiux ginsengi]
MTEEGPAARFARTFFADFENAAWLPSSDGTKHMFCSGQVVRGAEARARTTELFERPGDTEPEAPISAVGWIPYEYSAATLGGMRVASAGRPQFLITDHVVTVKESTGSGNRTPYLPKQNVRWRDSEDEYLRKIASCVDRIRAGDAYVLCLTSRASMRSATGWDAIATFAALRQSSPGTRQALLRMDGISYLVASPERFLTIAGERVVSSPIKGTRARYDDPGRDAEAAHELQLDEKERAENLMIVDLVRNDLSRVCVPGSVLVEELFAVKSYLSVHQLESTVSGTLAPGSRLWSVIDSLFPAGSMTGAPKRSATNILRSLEGEPRGLYAGAFGTIGAGRMDLSMSIRGITLDGQLAHIGTGGGITALSDPGAEYQEMRLKAESALSALRAAD